MMRNISTFAHISTALLFFGITGCRKDVAPISTADELTEYLKDEMDYQHIPAMGVLVFNKDAVLYEKYLGVPDRNSSAALTDEHLFLLASISKTITATALMQLYDQGLFGLDDPINNYLPFDVTVPGHSTPITFRMLLTHTSGIADGPALDNHYYYGQDSPVELAAFMESYLTPGGSNYDADENFHDFTPGTEHEYSNEGAALIAVLVESISGTEFNTYCKQNIFLPLGMLDTYWSLDEITQPIVVPYDYVSGDYESYDHYTFTDYPNGGLRSTPRDLHRFLLVYMQANSTLLATSTVNSMLSPQIPDIDEEVGLHFFILDDEYDLWGHDGGEKGVATIMAWNKQNGNGAIILTNQGEAELEDLLMELYLFALER
jgi:CubicO group peptidase (beta-lactamase class C family)